MSEMRVTITPKQAQDWLDKFVSDKVQRNLDRKWVSKFAESMKSGKFGGNSPIQLRELDGVIHLIDGRTRLNAVVEAGVPQSFVVISDKVNSETQLIDEFRYYNDGRRVTLPHMFQAMQLVTKTGLTQQQLNQLSGAIALIDSDFLKDGTAITIDRRVDLMLRYTEPAKMYFEALSGAAKLIQKPLQRAASIAVGVCTFDESIHAFGQKKVFDFWHGVAQMVNEKKGDPRATAVNNLLTTIPPGSIMRSGLTVRSAEYSARALASCFNAWVKGRTLEGIRINDPAAPLYLEGSSRFKG